jgi:ribonuclease HII
LYAAQTNCFLHFLFFSVTYRSALVTFPDQTSVSAASIVAKVQRDWALLELEEAYGLALGSGYPSDPLTVQFLQQIFDDEGNAITKVPPFVRKTWAKKSFGQQTA